MEDLFPSINIQLDNYVYKLSPKSYLTKSKYFEGVCTLEKFVASGLISDIFGDGRDFWILGTPFLDQFYQVYDYERK